MKSLPPAASVEKFFEKLRIIRINNAAGRQFDAALENCIFYISPMYEFSHGLGPSLPLATRQLLDVDRTSVLLSSGLGRSVPLDPRAAAGPSAGGGEDGGVTVDLTPVRSAGPAVCKR